jgi:putative transposase
MARKPRVEYAGAVYHVMNRGDRGEPAFKDKLDYELFLSATSEVCKRTGWRIHAWVLLPNHFHWLLETPAANLVAGMKWFLGAYSQRFNARHGQRGHVFQGRYKAVVVEAESGAYFETVSTYIHLNPARAGLLKDPARGLEQYPWSSYPSYLGRPKARPPWLAVDRVLGNLALRDDGAGRRRYGEFMEGRVAELRTAAGKRAFREEWSAIRHGWYVGGAEFGELLIEKVKGVVGTHDRRSYGGEAVCRHDEQEAESLIRRGMRDLRLTDEDLTRLPKGHPHKKALANLAHSRTLVSHLWLSQRLHMGHPQNLSLYIKQARNAPKPLINSGRKS